MCKKLKKNVSAFKKDKEKLARIIGNALYYIVYIERYDLVLTLNLTPDCHRELLYEAYAIDFRLRQILRILLQIIIILHMTHII